MPPKSSHYRMADRLAGGQLEQILHGFVSEGLSPDAIAARLYADHGVEVTGTTVAAWVQALPPATAEAAS